MKEVFSFRSDRVPRTLFRLVNIIFLSLLAAIMILPMLKVVSDSLDRSTVYGLRFWPTHFSFFAYEAIFTQKELFLPLVVSLVTTLSGTLIGLALTTLGAYVLRKRDLIGRAFFSRFVFVTMIFNGGLIPTFLVLQHLEVTNTLWAVILPGALNVFNMVLMRNFFEQVPESLFESAAMDGATSLTVFVKIVLPLSSAALASVGLFYVVQFWNDFFPYVIYISNTDFYNFQIKLRELILSDQNLTDPSLVGFGSTVKNAAVIVAILPFLVLYPFVQRHFTAGVTMGALKE